MPTSSPILALPTPLTSESPDGPAQMGAINTRLDAVVGMAKIAELTPTSGAIAFTSIPATFRHLRVEGVLRSDGSGAYDSDALLRLNNDATGYAWTALTTLSGSGPTRTSGLTGAATSVALGLVPNLAAGAPGEVAAVVVDVLNYADAVRKVVLARFVASESNAGSGVRIVETGGKWTGTAVVNRLDFFTTAVGRVLDASSRLTLYGVR